MPYVKLKKVKSGSVRPYEIIEKTTDKKRITHNEMGFSQRSRACMLAGFMR